MYSDTDMLSFEEIDNDVARIFKVYCDTSLIEFSEYSKAVGDGKRDVAAYWGNVIQFRRLNLCPYDRPDMLRLAPPKLKETPRISAEDFKHASGFVYWFDVRAAHWATGNVDPTLLRALPTAKLLLSLYRQMQVVQQRIDDASLLEDAKAAVKGATKGASGASHAKGWTAKDATIFLASRVQAPKRRAGASESESDE